MFVTFGFSVAQGMNDLKQEFIDKQLELNNELESKVDIRTADLRKTSEELTAANNDIKKVFRQLVSSKTQSCPGLTCHTTDSGI